MQTVAFLLLANLHAGPGEAVVTSTAAGALEVTVTGLRNAKGGVLVAVHNTSKTFPSKVTEAARRAGAKIVNGRATATITGLVSGTYAVSVVHDENGNGDLDTNFLGIPKEGVGASNNPKPRMGPPRFREAKFELGDAPVRQAIKIRYL